MHCTKRSLRRLSKTARTESSDVPKLFANWAEFAGLLANSEISFSRN